ncbi:hypothetical protein J4476_03315 [Candidatus Woesearchaeota archaeon]|nr:MAG: hypothetical protein QT09_C0006G0026 [archaeon GW2011_AR18]MBS3161698.1 hypothetical protein [Candidatus Woesearchaeota archaeon]HIH25708.1 hypothetical protein [Nanoarchaeota archaeon]
MKKLLITAAFALTALGNLTAPKEAFALDSESVATPDPAEYTETVREDIIPEPLPTPLPSASPEPISSTEDRIRIGSIEILGTYDTHTRLSAAKEKLTEFDEWRGDIYLRVDNVFGGKDLGADIYTEIAGQHGRLNSGVFEDAGERKMTYRPGALVHLNINDILKARAGLGLVYTNGSKWVLETMPRSDIYALGGEGELGANLRLSPELAVDFGMISRIQHRKVGNTDYGKEKDTAMGLMLELNNPGNDIYMDIGTRLRFDSSDVLANKPGSLDSLAEQTSNRKTVDVLRRVQPNSYALQPRFGIGTKVGPGAVGLYIEGPTAGPEQNVHAGLDLSYGKFVLSWRVTDDQMDGQRRRQTYTQVVLKYNPENNRLRLYKSDIDNRAFMSR